MKYNKTDNKSGVIEVLLAAKAKVHIKNKNGFSAVECSIYRDNPLIFEQLMEGIDSNLQKTSFSRYVDVKYTNSDKETFLHVAVRKGHLKIVECLIQAGADIEAKTNKGVTPLRLAVINGYPEIFTTLLDVGAEIKNAQHSLYSLFLNLAYICTSERHIQIMEILLEKNLADVNELMELTGDTALHRAVYNGSIEMVKFLLNHGADREILNKKSKKAFDVVKKNDKEMQNFLFGIEKATKSAEKLKPFLDQFGSDITKILKNFINANAKPWGLPRGCSNPHGFVLQFLLCSYENKDIAPINASTIS